MPGSFLSFHLAEAGQNANFTLPLHGIWPVTFDERCATPASQGVDCSYSGRPTVNLPAGAMGLVAIYIFVHNYTRSMAIHTAFEFAPWTVLFGRWSCIPGSVTGLTTPHDPGGPLHGFLEVSWPCVTDPSLLVVGFMMMNITSPGCVSQVEPVNRRIAVLDCNFEWDELVLPGPDELRLGRVCVGSGGHDACDVVVPVENETWGRIKGQYRTR